MACKYKGGDFTTICNNQFDYRFFLAAEIPIFAFEIGGFGV
jgi:hypothetical protein